MSCPCDPSGIDKTPCPDPQSKLPACRSPAEHSLAKGMAAIKQDPQLREEREKHAAMLDRDLHKAMAKAGGRLIPPATKAREVAPAAAWPFPGANRASAGDINPDQLKAAQHRAEIAQLGKPRYGVLSLPEFEALCKLKPFLGIVESALREYANSSRDLDEQLHARRAIDAVVAAQQVKP